MPKYSLLKTPQGYLVYGCLAKEMAMACKKAHEELKIATNKIRELEYEMRKKAK